MSETSVPITTPSAVPVRKAMPSRYARLPETLIQEAVGAVQDGIMTVAEFARQHNVNPVTLRSAVRRRLADTKDVSVAELKRRAVAQEMGQVESLQADGLSLRDACAAVGADYLAVAKRQSRERHIPVFEAIQYAMLKAGMTEDDLVRVGSAFRQHKDQAVPAGETFATWLGPVFAAAARQGGLCPEAVARDFVRWKAGRF